MSALDKLVENEELGLRQRMEAKLVTIQATTGIKLTDEQKELALDIEHDIMSNSVPGSGKTSTAVALLLNLILNKIVPESQITALSFTTAATGELKYRYIEAAEKMGKTRHTIDFATIHAMCSDILRKYHTKIGLKEYTRPKPMSYAEITKLLIDLGEEMGIPVTKENVRRVKRAIDDLNGSLIFDPRHIATRQSFIECKLSVEEITALRKEIYVFDQQVGTVQQQELLLYTLEILLKNPEICAEQKARRKVLLCDEFQDLSLLQMKLLDLIGTRLIFIGDVDQQIYGWAGASPKIVDDFRRLRPNFVEHPLTQSFRCGQEIVEAAKDVIRPNNPNINSFKGLDREARVEISDSMDLGSICDNILADYKSHDSRFSRSSLFLYRTNFSILPIYEELYKREIPARSDKFVKAYDIDIISEIVTLMRIAKNPKDVNNFWVLKKLIPELQAYASLYDMPLVAIVSQTGQSLLEIDYEYQDPYAGAMVMDMLSQVRELYLANESVLTMFNTIWPVYDELYYSDNFYRYAQDIDYYLALVQPIIANKNFDEFIKDEDDKEAEVIKWNKMRTGVRCYTLHSAKGLEADDVYILDAEDDILPNSKRLDRTRQLGCTLDAAVTVRNERSLAYVGVTRAKYNVYIGYTRKVADILVGRNKYADLDRAYTIMKHDYEDIEYFKELISDEDN